MQYMVTLAANNAGRTPVDFKSRFLEKYHTTAAYNPAIPTSSKAAQPESTRTALVHRIWPWGKTLALLMKQLEDPPVRHYHRKGTEQ